MDVTQAAEALMCLKEGLAGPKTGVETRNGRKRRRAASDRSIETVIRMLTEVKAAKRSEAEAENAVNDPVVNTTSRTPPPPPPVAPVAPSVKIPLGVHNGTVFATPLQQTAMIVTQPQATVGQMPMQQLNNVVRQVINKVRENAIPIPTIIAPLPLPPPRSSNSATQQQPQSTAQQQPQSTTQQQPQLTMQLQPQLTMQLQPQLTMQLQQSQLIMQQQQQSPQLSLSPPPYPQAQVSMPQLHPQPQPQPPRQRRQEPFKPRQQARARKQPQQKKPQQQPPQPQQPPPQSQQSQPQQSQQPQQPQPQPQQQESQQQESQPHPQQHQSQPQPQQHQSQPQPQPTTDASVAGTTDPPEFIIYQTPVYCPTDGVQRHVIQPIPLETKLQIINQKIDALNKMRTADMSRDENAKWTKSMDGLNGHKARLERAIKLRETERILRYFELQHLLLSNFVHTLELNIDRARQDVLALGGKLSL